MQGTLLSNHHQGLPMLNLMKALKYDAAAMGNHEFDFGPSTCGEPTDPRGALKVWTSGSPFPLLTANITLEDEHARRPRWPNVSASVVLVRGGARVGLIGVTTPTTPRVTMPDRIKGLVFGPMSRAVKLEAAALRETAGVHAVVLLAHAGGKCQGRDPGSCQGEAFGDLLDRLPAGAVDAMVMGHSHSCIWHRYKGTLVSEACSQGIAVGQLRLVIDLAAGKVRHGASEALAPFPSCHDVFSDSGGCDASQTSPGSQVIENPLLARHREQVERAASFIPAFRANLKDTEQRVLGQLARPLLHSLSGASGPGLLAAQAMLHAVPGADVAILNPRAVRADLPAGDVTYGQLYGALPFENRLATARLTGAELRALLNAGMSYRGDIFQVAGMSMTARCGPPPWVLGLQDRDGRPLDPGMSYRVVLSDFLLSGGDGLGPVLDKIPGERKRVLPAGTVRGAVEDLLGRASKPLNSEVSPLLSSARPQLILEGGPCNAGKEPVRYLCR